jgi:predicted nucleotidyltransferase component of viral defense system
MISSEEVKQIAVDQGVPLPSVEKDYVMGWLLWGIYTHPEVGNNLVLKGGNCLRKIYFPDTRFSDDLDFTTYQLEPNDIFRNHLSLICDSVSKASGIEFDTGNITVQLKDTPDQECKAIDARVYFKGFAGDSSLTMRIKFDVSEYEKIVLPIQQHPILHHYSDAHLVDVKVATYSLEEVLAEKLRSWIQRTRPRDLFDVAKIIQSKVIPINKRQILSAFFSKTLFKNIPMASKEEMMFDSKFKTVEQGWGESIICPKNAIILAGNAITLFRDFIEALFTPSGLQVLGFAAGIGNYGYNVSSGFREVIIEAGKERKLLRLKYSNKDRDVEPYSFRFKRGKECFFGFDRTRDQTIKNFHLSSVQGVSILPTQFIPRWEVEF